MTKPWHPVPGKGIARISHKITKRKKKEAKKKEKLDDYDVVQQEGTDTIHTVGPDYSPMWVHFSRRLPHTRIFSLLLCQLSYLPG